MKITLFEISFCVVFYLSFWQIKKMINEICDFLGIECFRIKPVDNKETK